MTCRRGYYHDTVSQVCNICSCPMPVDTNKSVLIPSACTSVSIIIIIIIIIIISVYIDCQLLIMSFCHGVLSYSCDIRTCGDLSLCNCHNALLGAVLLTIFVCLTGNNQRIPGKDIWKRSMDSGLQVQLDEEDRCSVDYDTLTVTRRKLTVWVLKSTITRGAGAEVD